VNNVVLKLLPLQITPTRYTLRYDMTKMTLGSIYGNLLLKLDKSVQNRRYTYL